MLQLLSLFKGFGTFFFFFFFFLRFWNLLAPYCTVHSAVKEIPFVTSTCRGCGKTANIDGKVICS